MITKIFKSYKYNETKKTLKTIKDFKYEEETYFEIVTKSERVYQPPTGVSHCLHCGERLRDTMWVFGKSGKYLCKDCWYNRTTSYQKEKYREQAQKMSSGGYSYNTTEERVPKTRKIKKEFEKEIEIEELVTLEGFKVVWPTDINHPKNNKPQIFNIELNKYFNSAIDLLSPNHINDESIIKDELWYGASSFKNAISKANKQLNNKNLQRVKIFNLDNIPFEEVIVEEKQVLEEFVDIVGFYPNVPAYIQGHPLNMYNNKRINVRTIDEVVTIYCNLAIDARCDYNHYKNRGIIIFSLIEYLLNNNNKNYRVNLKLVDATFIEGQTIVLEFNEHTFKKLDFKDPNIIEKKEKQERELNYLYNMLTSLSFYRVLILDKKWEIIQDNKLDYNWHEGLGYCLKNKDLIDILSLKDEVLVFGDPFEHGINGLFLDDDFENAMESLKINTPYKEITNSENEEKNLLMNVNDVIKLRNITKLIHVTAENNIEKINDLGLLTKDELNSKSIDYHQNDFLRLDRQTNAICLSVSEPNEYLFQEYSKRNPNVKYKVIEISPKILYEIKNEELEVKRIYSDYNAASRYSKTSEFDMNIMFQERIRRKAKIHTRDGLESYQPTSGQAEILFFGSIPPKYFIDIYDYEPQDLKESRRKEKKTISQVAREIGNVTPQELHKKLLDLGYLQTKYEDKKAIYYPTEKGEKIGIAIEVRKSKNEIYQVNVYSEKAEKIIKDLFE